MHGAFLTVTLVAAIASALSGLGAMLRLRTITTAMDVLGVPRSWLVFPIGTLKLAGAAGLFLGLLGVPIVGAAAGIGLILYFVCAIYTHLRAGDFSPQFGLANAFLTLVTSALVLQLAYRGFR